jgi:hypothetical protein
VSPRVVVAGLLAVFAIPSSLAAADSFTPVSLRIKVTQLARRQARLPIAVTVSADPSVLDTATTPLRIEVKLSAECGATFQTTPGTVLLDKPLNPQPSLGKAYSATMRGTGRPSAFGTFTVCAFLQETGDGEREYAQDTSNQVTVSQPCTAAASRFDAPGKRLAVAKRKLRHDRKGSAARRRDAKLLARRTKALNADRRAGRNACGAGVAL